MSRHYVYEEDIPEFSEYDFKKLCKKLEEIVKLTRDALGRTTLKPPLSYIFLSEFLSSSIATHGSIRKLSPDYLRTDGLADAISLGREQVEKVFMVAKFVDNLEEATRLYAQASWANLYMQHLIACEEMAKLDRCKQNNLDRERLLEQKRVEFDITVAQKHQLMRMVTTRNYSSGSGIANFPTPMNVYNSLKKDARWSHLLKWYEEYKRLCSFTHGLFEKQMLRISQQEYRKTFDISIASGLKLESDQGLYISSLAILSLCTDLFRLFNNETELSALLRDHWETMRETSLVAKQLWDTQGSTVVGHVMLLTKY